MSKRNSQVAKASARERLRAEREKQAKRDKIKRQSLVGGGVIAVLAIAAGAAFAINKATQPAPPTEWEAAAKKALVIPANASGKNGTSIELGNANAKNTLKVYEDMRCPICAAFEQNTGQEVLALEKQGVYKISYTMGTFLDGNNGGTGSKNALSALGAALNVSKDAFSQYHTLLYSAAVHPEETEDKFGSDTFLIQQAQKIPALKNNKKFQDAVQKGTYDKWALTMSNQFTADGVDRTPTVELNGTTIENVQAMPPAQFKSTIELKVVK